MTKLELLPTTIMEEMKMQLSKLLRNTRWEDGVGGGSSESGVKEVKVAEVEGRGTLRLGE
jgi:hypothetical protein